MQAQLIIKRQLQQAFLLSHQPAVYYTALKFLVRLLIGDKNALKIKPFYQALRRPQMLQRVAWAPPVAAGVVATTPSPWGKPHYQQAAWAKVGLPV